MSTALRLVKTFTEISGKRDYVNDQLAKEPRHGVLFYDFINITILRKMKRMGVSYAANYKTLITIQKVA